MSRLAFGFVGMICLLALSSAVSGEEKIPGQAVLEEKLQKRITAFDQQMVNGTKKEKVKALEDLLPHKKDIQILFPNDVEVIWKEVSQTRSRFTKNAERVSKQVSEWGTGTKRIPINARTENKDNDHEDVLAIISKDLPVYRVRYEGKIDGQQETDTLNTFIYVNGRWIYFFGFRSTPSTIKYAKEQ